MRRSPKRHPLAVLRLTLGLTQKEMAHLADCSTTTVQSIELGRLPLSADLARHISIATGVSREWLAAGDPKSPIITDDAQPYTREMFEQFRAELLLHGRSSADRAGEHDAIPAILATAVLILYCILRREDKSVMLRATKIHSAIGGLVETLGVDRELARQLKATEFDAAGDTLQ